VTSKGFASALGRALGRPAFLPAPGFALKLLLGEMSEMLLGGQRVVPVRAEESGFTFQFPELEAALQDLLA
jgi:NAD dependent epimerase/dehydratase family enzyme